ncbi:MAG TPA: BMA_0021/BMA_0022 family TOMM bacteriocin [Polyangiaceae bacterium]|jgi:ribosomally synthesized peptide (two-chain TOMM family)
MSMDDLMQFRTVHLRAVARSWSDPAFKSRLVADPKGTLKSEFGFDFPWPFLDLKFGTNGPHWDPQNTGGWFGTSAPATSTASSITLILPVDASRITVTSSASSSGTSGPFTPADRAKALSDYYQQRPTLFGAKPAPTGGVIMPQQSFELGLGSWKDFLEFGGVTLRAIALAWARPEFATQVQDDALAALQAWLGYTCPWNLRIVVATQAFTWARDRGEWTNLPNNVLEVDLPETPKVDFQPVALTAYNNTGSAYPFTCCD